LPLAISERCGYADLDYPVDIQVISCSRTRFLCN
jgi:hypothetical protein